MNNEDSEDKNNVKLKRFDDIFRMTLLMVTIMISTGSISSDLNLSLWSTFIFVFISLSIWMLGHAIGSIKIMEDMEAVTKLYAWAFAIFAGLIVGMKFLSSSSYLSYELAGISGFLAMALTIPPYLFLSSLIPNLTRKKFIQRLVYSFISILVMVQLGATL